jgi:fluoride exporter
MIRELAVIGVGGAIGSMARYLVVMTSARVLSSNYTHYGTLTVNCIGSFLVTLFMVLYIEKFDLSESVRLFIVVGFLGGFTTFSAFSYESVAMLHAKQFQEAFTYMALSLILSLSFAFAGFFAAKAFIK